MAHDPTSVLTSRRVLHKVTSFTSPIFFSFQHSTQLHHPWLHTHTQLLITPSSLLSLSGPCRLIYLLSVVRIPLSSNYIPLGCVLLWLSVRKGGRKQRRKVGRHEKWTERTKKRKAGRKKHGGKQGRTEGRI